MNKIGVAAVLVAVVAVVVAGFAVVSAVDAGERLNDLEYKLELVEAVNLDLWDSQSEVNQGFIDLWETQLELNNANVELWEIQQRINEWI